MPNDLIRISIHNPMASSIVPQPITLPHVHNRNSTDENQHSFTFNIIRQFPSLSKGEKQTLSLPTEANLSSHPQHSESLLDPNPNHPNA